VEKYSPCDEKVLSVKMNEQSGATYSLWRRAGRFKARRIGESSEIVKFFTSEANGKSQTSIPKKFTSSPPHCTPDVLHTVLIAVPSHTELQVRGAHLRASANVTAMKGLLVFGIMEGGLPEDLVFAFTSSAQQGRAKEDTKVC
jgi:hypothetical protein